MAKKNTGKPNSTQQFPVVGIGASAGGLDAFKSFVKAIPKDPGMAYILVQHLHPDFESTLSDILQRETSIPVLKITNELKIKAGHIYITPPNKLILVNDDSLRLITKDESNETHHPIDVFFSSLAEVYQADAIGVVLSGLGSDGTIGLKKIKENGGITFAQTEDSAAYASMPQHAIGAEVVDFIMLPQEMPKRMMEMQHTFKSIPVEVDKTPSQLNEEDDFKQILALLRVRRGVDFTYYKQSTIRRRILRRMVINKIEKLPEYLQQLRSSKAEQDILYQDLLIPVTAFFRDTATFEHVCDGVLPDLVKNKSATNPLRIWVAGCSTGEEAYSIGMCLYEFLGEKLAGIKIQIFATDISEKAIIKARTGIYNTRELENVSEKRLQQYFNKVDGSYQVKKSIRDMCVFATHNFLKDPPFARIDLVSCRNVLIYMESYLQKKALNTFYYALNDKGFLLLGKSETTSNAADLFASAGKHEKLYTKKPAHGRFISFNTERSEKITKENDILHTLEKRKNDFQKNADEILLAKFSPAGVVINGMFDIVQFRGATSDFIQALPGKASLNIFKMVRDGLAFEIRNALHKAKQTGEAFIKEYIPLKDEAYFVRIEVIPLMNTIESHYLVLFTKQGKELTSEINGKKTKARKADKNEEEAQSRIQQLEKELSQLREDIRSITEDQEAANEELQSANEELLSGSEELQSLNEELETSKEELESTNEELMTINQELFERSEQYNQARIYTETIVRTIHEPLIVLNKDLRVKSANQSLYSTFLMQEDEIMGKIIFELQDGKWDIPEFRSPLLKVQSGKEKYLEWELSFYFNQLGEKTFNVIAQFVEGPSREPMIMIALDDITLRKKEIETLRKSAESIRSELKTLESFFIQAPAGFCILKGPDHVFQFANPQYISLYGIKDPEGKKLADVFPGKEKAEELRLLKGVYLTGKPYSASEVPAIVQNEEASRKIYLDISYQAIKNEDGEIDGVIVFFYDVTEKVNSRSKWQTIAKDFETQVRERTRSVNDLNTDLVHSNKSLEQFASIASHDLQEPLRKIQTFIAILMERYQDSLGEKPAELISKIDTSAKRMSTLIKAVLNYSKMNKSTIVYSLTNLNYILQNSLKDYDHRIKEKKAVVHFNEMPVIEADPMQMSQLFNNLLSNALKFARTDIEPVINITYSKPPVEEIKIYPGLNPDLNYAKIIFQDNGIGFAPEFSEQIFNIFQRLNNASEYPGTGIGLALCQNIVFGHQGMIWATSDKKEGTVFNIILPVKHTAH